MRNKRLKDRRHDDREPEPSLIITLVVITALMLGAFYTIINNKIAPDDSNKWVEWVP